MYVLLLISDDLLSDYFLGSSCMHVINRCTVTRMKCAASQLAIAIQKSFQSVQMYQRAKGLCTVLKSRTQWMKSTEVLKSES